MLHVDGTGNFTAFATAATNFGPPLATLNDSAGVMTISTVFGEF
jgi:hypothetical protein